MTEKLRLNAMHLESSLMFSSSLGFVYGNLEMSNASAIAIGITGVLTLSFFVIASIKTDIKGVLDWSKETFSDDT